MPEFYGTVVGYKAYHLARGHDVAVREDEEIASDLLVASEWIDARFRAQFNGTKTGDRTQIRDWPRTDATDIYGHELSGIPRELEYATYEAAAIQGANLGALSVNFTPGKYESVSVEGAVSVKYAKIMNWFEAQTQFAIVNEILAPILTGKGISGMLFGRSILG